MTQELNEKDKKFLEETKKHQKEKAQEIVLKVLTKMFEADTAIFDGHYIVNRATQMVEDAIQATKFSDKEIRKIRKENLKNRLEKVISNIKSSTVPSPADATEERNNLCEDAAMTLATSILNEDLVFSNDNYLNTAIDEDNQLLLTLLARGYLNSVYGELVSSLDESVRLAHKKMWGVDKERVSMRALDQVLKSEPSVGGTEK